MHCLSRGFSNPLTVLFCQSCGARLDLTADEIQASYIDKKRSENIKSAEQHGQNLLLFALAGFLLAITIFAMTGGAPDESYFIPSASNGSKYVEVEVNLKSDFERLAAPLTPSKREDK